MSSRARIPRRGLLLANFLVRRFMRRPTLCWLSWILNICLWVLISCSWTWSNWHLSFFWFRVLCPISCSIISRSWRSACGIEWSCIQRCWIHSSTMLMLLQSPLIHSVRPCLHTPSGAFWADGKALIMSGLFSAPGCGFYSGIRVVHLIMWSGPSINSCNRTVLSLSPSGVIGLRSEVQATYRSLAW